MAGLDNSSMCDEGLQSAQIVPSGIPPHWKPKAGCNLTSCLLLSQENCLVSPEWWKSQHNSEVSPIMCWQTNQAINSRFDAAVFWCEQYASLELLQTTQATRRLSEHHTHSRPPSWVRKSYSAWQQTTSNIDLQSSTRSTSECSQVLLTVSDLIWSYLTVIKACREFSNWILQGCRTALCGVL